MSKLYRVTITGADDSVRVPDLVDLSREYPFVEWGILVSRRQQGQFRFPLREWMDRLADVAPRNGMQLSMHICGAWVRQMFVNELNWSDLPVSLLSACQRVQINTHAERHASTVDFIKSLYMVREKQIIFQWDGVNDHLIWAARQMAPLDVAALFDTSGGAGVLPKEWPAQLEAFPCGYAGGLGPENVIAEIVKINAATVRPFWIDMERRVRSADDSKLDLEKVRLVLKRMKSFVLAAP